MDTKTPYLVVISLMTWQSWIHCLRNGFVGSACSGFRVIFFVYRECDFEIGCVGPGAAFLVKLGIAQLYKEGIYTLGGCEFVIMLISDISELVHG